MVAMCESRLMSYVRYVSISVTGIWASVQTQLE